MPAHDSAHDPKFDDAPEDPDFDSDLDDLLPDSLKPQPSNNKGKAVPAKRSKKQQEIAARREREKAEAEALQAQTTAARAAAARLAQIVNLHIAGFSLADIGAQIGATEDEVDRMLASDAQRYIRSQPALRTYVRNYVSGKYNALLDAVWDEATDKNARGKLENQDRALRILNNMAKLHGAEAPTQAEVTIDAAPETVERMVERLAAGQGLAYDIDVFNSDVVDAEVVDEAVREGGQNTQRALEESSRAVEEETDDDQF